MLQMESFIRAPSALRHASSRQTLFPSLSSPLSRPSNRVIIPLQKYNTQSQTPKRPTKIQLNDRPYPEYAERRCLLQDRVVGIHVRNLDEVAACCHAHGEEEDFYEGWWEGGREDWWGWEGVEDVEEDDDDYGVLVAGWRNWRT